MNDLCKTEDKKKEDIKEKIVKEISALKVLLESLNHAAVFCDEKTILDSVNIFHEQYKQVSGLICILMEKNQNEKTILDNIKE